MNKPQRVILWGDSVAKGVVYDEAQQRYTLARVSAASIVAQRLGIEVVNRAHLGLTIDGGIAQIEKDLARGVTAEYAVVEFGGNDSDYDWTSISCTPDSEHFSKTPPERFEQRLREALARVARAGITPVLCTLPPIVSQRYFDFVSRSNSAANILRWLGSVDRIGAYHGIYSEINARVARELGLPLLDVRGTFAEHDPCSLFCIDGIHPNAEGQVRIGESLSRMLTFA